MMLADYLLRLLTLCSEERFGQDAIEWAIVSGWVNLSYDQNADLHAIMDRYDDIIEAYQRVCRDLEGQTGSVQQPEQQLQLT